MAPTLTLADYLFARLKQLGIGAVHGVPGDYNLHLLDFVEPAGLLWVGNANELNAGYAADGYARIKGAGALITTFGVGELSAINAIACAYTERAAVVHIVGTPARQSQESRLNIHHTLGDGDYRHFAQMQSHVTVAQTNLLDPLTATEQIDSTLRQCLIHSRPVYIEIPVDMVAIKVSADRLSNDISVQESVPDPALYGALQTVLNRMYAAKQPVILIDGETRALGLVDGVQKLVNSTNWPTFTTGFSKGLIDMTASNVHGIYQGDFADAKTKAFIDGADLIMCFGPHHSSTNSYNFSNVPRKEVSVTFTQKGIQTSSDTFRVVSIKDALQDLLQKLDTSKIKKYEGLELPHDRLVSFSEVSGDEIIKQDKVWRILANFLQPGDIVMGETGTPGYGVREMPLPKHTRFFSPVTWLSIGYMLPACQGAALGQQELIASGKYHDLKAARTVLFIGDGSFQMTCQELATIIRHNLNVVIFLINNDGYTIERCIHGLNQGYNDISKWRYLNAPSLFGATEDCFTGSARTYGELQKVLDDPKLMNGSGLRMVEVFMDRNDAPIGPLLNMINKQKETELSTV